jgi:serine/threonine protein phosphatase PrpC
VKIIGRTHPGQVRPNNEDAFDFDVERGVAVLADGMGGLNAGEVASATAVAAILGELADVPELTAQAISAAIETANQHVYELSQKNRELRNMGTTVVVWATLDAGRLAIAHVGDSRAYRLNDAGVAPLTNDHSVVQAMVDQGLMTVEEARVATNRNIITRAVGLDVGVHVEVQEVAHQPGDRYLLCSDGLTDMLDHGELQSLWDKHRGGPMEALAEHFVDAAVVAGGYDNVSVVLVD